MTKPMSSRRRDLGWRLCSLSLLCLTGGAGVACGAAFTTEQPGGSEGGAPGDSGSQPVDAQASETGTSSDGAASDGPLADGSAPPEAGVADAADAASRYCAPGSAAAAMTFCEDFNAGVPGRFTAEVLPMSLSVGAGIGATIVADSTNAYDARESMLATTAAVTTAGQRSYALGSFDFSTFTALQYDGQHFTFQAWFAIDSTCLGAGGGVTIAAVSFPGTASHYTLALVVTPTGTVMSGGAIVEATGGGDAGAVATTTHAFTATVTPGAWTEWSVDFNLGAVIKTAAVSVGTAAPVSERLTAAPAAALFERPTLDVGASIKDIAGAQPACSVRVDDVTFNIAN